MTLPSTLEAGAGTVPTPRRLMLFTALLASALSRVLSGRFHEVRRAHYVRQRDFSTQREETLPGGFHGNDELLDRLQIQVPSLQGSCVHSVITNPGNNQVPYHMVLCGAEVAVLHQLAQRRNIVPDLF